MNDTNIDKQLREAEVVLRSAGTLGQFTEYLDNQHYTISLKTKEKYLQILKQFQNQELSIIPFLRTRKSLAALGAVKKALLCIEFRELSRSEIFKTKRFPVERQALHTSIEDRERIIESIPDPKLRLIAKIQHDTGCRASEAVGLKRQQIMAGPDDRTKLHLKTKGSKTRDCYLSQGVSKELDVFLDSLPNDQEEVFFDKHAVALWTEYTYYWKAVNKAAIIVFGREAIKSARFGTHGFRFGLARDVYEATHSVLDVKKALGHAHISTSAIYAEGVALSSLEFVKKLREGNNGDLQISLLRQGNAEERENCNPGSESV